MAKLYLEVDVSDELAARYGDCEMMVVPLFAGEKIEFANGIVTTLEYLKLVQRNLSTLQQVLESTGDKDGQIAKTIHMLFEPTKSVVKLHDRTLEVIGRGFFASLLRKGPLQ